ncbi:MAG: putative transporter [Bacteroidales bacterium]|nr:putative transporter [Bacteroidales bacterium]MBQ9596882.1 putative transporter [Bacteroidales bacterium]
MERMTDLFTGTGIAHSILLFAFVMGSGLLLGRFHVKGVSIGSTWILFLGIVLSHFGFKVHPMVLAFMKDFGLILFVFSIGLQVGPGFFQSFRKGGVLLNLLAAGLILLSVGVTVAIHFISGEELNTMVGVMSGAVTNTPGLGAAQTTLTEVLLEEGTSPQDVDAISANMASAYAVAYPLGVLGVIAVLMLMKSLFKVDLQKEKEQLDQENSARSEFARRMHCEVRNPAVFNKTIGEAVGEMKGMFIVSRLMRNGQIFIPDGHTILMEGDKLLIVTSQHHVDSVRVIFGEEIPMHLQDWQSLDEHYVSRRLVVTRSKVNGKSLRDLDIRANFGIQVTRVIRAGMELVAIPNLILQMGDVIQVVGSEAAIKHLEKLVGNHPDSLNKANLMPIFFGIVLGVIVGSIPIHFHGIPQPVKLGLAGGPLIVAILLGCFGPRWKIATYTTVSANQMIRELGINIFLAAVGLGAGGNFVSSLMNGGFWWILYGFLITVIPVVSIALIARYVFKINFYKICGLVAGGTTDPAALSFAQEAYGTEYAPINYVTVYPLSMFLRVLVAQMMILFAIA